MATSSASVFSGSCAWHPNSLAVRDCYGGGGVPLCRAQPIPRYLCRQIYINVNFHGTHKIAVANLVKLGVTWAFELRCHCLSDSRRLVLVLTSNNACLAQKVHSYNGVDMCLRKSDSVNA